MVESTIRYSKSGSSGIASKIRHQTPLMLYRLKRRNTLFHRQTSGIINSAHLMEAMMLTKEKQKIPEGPPAGFDPGQDLLVWIETNAKSTAIYIARIYLEKMCTSSALPNMPNTF
jgi:hypothetical protein